MIVDIVLLGSRHLGDLRSRGIVFARRRRLSVRRTLRASHRLRSLLLEMRVRANPDRVLAGAVVFQYSPGGTCQGCR
jgi:hypothetical protein